MIQDRTFSELSGFELYGIVQLRSEVFVVEQRCLYADLDGRDTAPQTRHIFLFERPVQPPAQRNIASYLRVLSDGETYTIGRVVTAASQRSHGLAARLIQHVLRHSNSVWTLNAQTQLEAWYQQFGFVRNGDDFDEDGILHLPMHRPPAQGYSPDDPQSLAQESAIGGSAASCPCRAPEQ